MIKKPIAPCKGCKDRYVLCHSDCKKYITFKEEQDKYKEELNHKKQQHIINMTANLWDDRKRKRIMHK